MQLLAGILLGAVPQAAIIYVQATLLPMRRTWLFVLVEALLCCAAVGVKLAGPAAPWWAGNGLAALAMVVAPLAFYRREVPLAWRVVACAVAVLLLCLGEMSGGALWVASGHEYTPEGVTAVDPLLNTAVHLFFAAVVLTGGRVFKSLMAGWSKTTLSRSGGALFCAMPISQALLVWVLLELMIQASPADRRGVLLAGALGLLAFCMLTDALLITSVQRYRRALMEKARAELLEQHLEEQLAEQARTEERIAGTARLRHDMRNHLLVLQQLARRGELDQARAYIDETLTELGRNADAGAEGRA